MEEYSFDTKILHTPFNKDDAHGSLKTPIYNTAAYGFNTSAELEQAFMGTKPAHVYSRSTNPTVEHFEKTIANITGAFGVLALSSGMAAISNVIMSVASARDNIVTTKHVFGNTFSLFESTLKPFGVSIKYVDLTKPEELEQAIDENTRAVFFETITNPQLEVVDIPALTEIAKRKGIISIVDSTVTPPNIFNAKKLGIDIEVLSSTKYISGGGTSVGGLILDYGTVDWSLVPRIAEDYKKLGPFAFMIKLRREVYRNLGACLSPENAFLQSLGLETLSLRVGRSSSNTLKLAQWLAQQPNVKSVNYPGLSNSPYHSLAKSQFGDMFGGILTVDLDTKEACFEFMDKLKLFSRATNLNDNKSLILHPASTIYCEFSPEKRAELGVPETMMRVSVGIEDVKDLIGDMNQALND